MTNVKLLKELIQQSGFKKSFLADKIGVSRTTFAALLNNQAEFKASQISTLCEVLGIRDDATIREVFFTHNGALKATDVTS